MKVLFICRANAGRSQMAEALYNSLTHSHDARSAGVDLQHSILKDDLSVPPLVIETLAREGFDVSSARRKGVTPTDIDAVDFVIVLMNESEFPLPDFVKDSPKLVRWGDVPDAKGTDLEFHKKVFAQIREKVSALV